MYAPLKKFIEKMENLEVKRPYVKPEFQVIELSETPMLLAGSVPTVDGQWGN